MVIVRAAVLAAFLTVPVSHSVAGTTAIQSGPVCSGYRAAERYLNTHGEKVAYTGQVRIGVSVEVFISPDSGTFTVLARRGTEKRSTACFLATGTNFGPVGRRAGNHEP